MQSPRSATGRSWTKRLGPAFSSNMVRAFSSDMTRDVLATASSIGRHSRGTISRKVSFDEGELTGRTRSHSSSEKLGPGLEGELTVFLRCTRRFFWAGGQTTYFFPRGRGGGGGSKAARRCLQVHDLPSSPLLLSSHLTDIST